MKILKNIKYFIGFITLTYLGYLFLKNVNNKKKIDKLTRKVNVITEKNNGLIHSNNNLIKKMVKLIHDNKTLVDAEKEISVADGNAKTNVINAEARFKTDVESREKRIAKWVADNDHISKEEYE